MPVISWDKENHLQKIWIEVHQILPKEEEEEEKVPYEKEVLGKLE
jgi:hypothetical protein